VSAYMVAAAAAQMAADDAASAAFAPLDADNATALQQSTASTMSDLPAFADLSEREQALVRRVVSSALGSGHADIA